MVIGLFIYFFVPETKGYTLEETAVLYDGVEALLELQRTAEEQVILDKVRDHRRDCQARAWRRTGRVGGYQGFAHPHGDYSGGKTVCPWFDSCIRMVESRRSRSSVLKHAP